MFNELWMHAGRLESTWWAINGEIIVVTGWWRMRRTTKASKSSKEKGANSDPCETPSQGNKNFKRYINLKELRIKLVMMTWKIPWDKSKNDPSTSKTEVKRFSSTYFFKKKKTDLKSQRRWNYWAIQPPCVEHSISKRENLIISTSSVLG